MAESTPGTEAPRRSVFFCAVDSWACAWYRCYVPGVALMKLGYKVVMDEQIQGDDLETADVVVIQQPSKPEELAAIRVANETGQLSVAELDDDLWNVLPGNPSYGFWSRPDVKYLATACVQEAQLVTVPTHILAERIKPMNPNVRVLPNMLPSEGWEYPEPKEQREDKVVIGWAGSTSHVGDIALIDAVVQQILDRYPQVEFAIAGGPPVPELRQHPRVRPLKSTDILGYPKLLEKFDIGVIPLADTAFNRNKSDLKFVEYSALGMPSVVSRLEPYLRSVKHGENGFFAATPSDWLKYLSRLVEDVELRRSVGATAQEFARTRRIEHAIDKWVRAYGLAKL
jgi:glycosyltransferase involved in cell wall biosynthesis